MLRSSLVQEIEPLTSAAGGAEPGGLHSHEEAWELLQSTLRAIAILASVCAYVAILGLMAAHHAAPRWDLYAGPLLLAFGAYITLAWQLPYRRRAVVFVASLFLCSLALDLAARQAQVQLLYTFACIAAGILLGPPVATLIAGLATIALVAPGRPLPAGSALVWNLGTLWLAAGLVWTAVGNLFFTVRRAQTDEAQAWLRAAEARTRRGELVRTQKALNEMYDLLQRTNHELAFARQQAEEARQIKAQFAANVSHELRTPLNLIMGFSDMMYRSPEVYGDVRWTPALRADIREIHRASRHLLGMVDDILDLSRIEAQRLPLRLEATDLGALIREVVATSQGLLRGKEIALAVDVPDGLPELLLDRTRIRQVLLNLLNNAIRFTDQGRIEVRASVADKAVTVAVTDTGVGIPANELQAIFEEFRQARGSITEGRGGAGLGLAICKQFVRLHGGHIEAESEVGRGSVFRFSLPLPDAGPAPAGLFYYAPEGWSPPVPENPLGKTAIVLGADPEVSAAIARAIVGYRTLPLSTLASLADKVEAEHPAGIVLLADPSAPEPLEPAQIWQAAGRRDLPIVRYPLPPREPVPPELGAAGYLVKPIQREQLIATLRRICPEPANLLLVDDDPGFVALLQRILGAEFSAARLRCAYSGQEALAALQEAEFDAVLLDLIMPGVDGLQVIAAMRREPRLAATPVLVTTGTGYGEETARRPGRIELLRYGGCSDPELGRYITMLLDAVPPDYSRPAPVAEPPAAPAATLAS